MKLKYNPNDVAATSDEMWQARKTILDLPVKTRSGEVFHFDRDSRESFELTLQGWEDSKLSSVDWRQHGKRPALKCSKAQLQSYFSECQKLLAKRSIQVDREYASFRKHNATKEELIQWVKFYQDALA